MTLRVKINFLLLAVLLLSTAYVAQVFVSSYQAELSGQKVEAATVRNDQAETILKDINFETATSSESQGVAISDQESSVAADNVNRLVVGSMSVNAVIHEGQTDKTLSQGLWHIPGTSTPDQGGNTVISAHRWKWLPTSGKSFYDIDKVAVGDTIQLTWKGQDYTYVVSKISTVTPDQVEILNNTAEDKLTLFSCAPLFSSKYRIVVEADRISG